MIPLRLRDQLHLEWALETAQPLRKKHKTSQPHKGKGKLLAHNAALAERSRDLFLAYFEDASTPDKDLTCDDLMEMAQDLAEEMEHDLLQEEHILSAHQRKAATSKRRREQEEHEARQIQRRVQVEQQRQEEEQLAAAHREIDRMFAMMDARRKQVTAASVQGK